MNASSHGVCQLDPPTGGTVQSHSGLTPLEVRRSFSLLASRRETPALCTLTNENRINALSSMAKCAFIESRVRSVSRPLIRSRKDVSRSGGPAERNHAKTSLSWKTEASFSIEYSLSVKSLLSRISHLIISCR